MKVDLDLEIELQTIELRDAARRKRSRQLAMAQFVDYGRL